MATVEVGCMCVQSTVVEETCIKQIKVIYYLRQFLLERTCNVAMVMVMVGYMCVQSFVVKHLTIV